MRNQIGKIGLLFLTVSLTTSCTLLTVKTNLFKAGTPDLKQGYWIEKTDNDALCIAKYVKGKKEGKAKIIYPSGEYTTLHYRNDKKEGIAKRYRKDGKLCSEIRYEADTAKETKVFCGPVW